MALCVSVVIDDIVSKIDKLYDYYVPQHITDEICVGIRVLVPFSNANITKKALVLAVRNIDDCTGLKQVIAVADGSLKLSPLQIELLEHIKKRYFVTYFRAYKTIIPRGVDIRINETYNAEPLLESKDQELYAFFKKHHNKVSYDSIPAKSFKAFNDYLNCGLIKKTVTAGNGIGQLTENMLVLNVEQSELDRYISEIDNRYQKQKDLLSVFYDYQILSEKDALYYSGCSQSTVKTLERKNIIRVEKRVIERNPYKDIERSIDRTPIKLSPEQQSAYNAITGVIDEYKTHLLYGVTGSGKTLVYMALIDKVIADGKSVIFMVPEISLTPQTLSRFYMRYGDSVSVVHSGLAPGERADEWHKIKRNNTSVIVGTRSAVFSPVNNLGLVIIDEEHEPSYKSENSPRYHTRDVAKLICRKLNIPLVLGSATPSIESNYYATRGIYDYHKLTKRFNNNPLPKARIIDMRDAFRQGEQSFLSSELKDAIDENLASGQQTILFLNRRGAHTMVGCRSCGYVAKCPNCGVALTYHIANGRCMCHYCGYNIRMFSECPECKSAHIKKLGIGTQLVYDELEQMFPKARVLRMDFDTVSSYVEYGNKLNSFKNGQYDIMLGTQMVAKGLDFPEVTLVGILNADLSLYVDDFRANERTFSLLTQVCGRSGRAGKEGVAYIQTYSPDYEIIRYAKEQDYNKYFEFEIGFRKAMNYPPFCDIIQFTVSDKSEKNAHNSVMELYSVIDNLSKNDFSDIPVRLLYPTVPKIARFNDRYRYNLVLKSRVSARLYEMLDYIKELFEKNMISDVSINVNPINNV